MDNINQIENKNRLISLFDHMKVEQIRPISINSNILVIDGMNLFIRNYTVNTVMNENGEHIGGIVGFLTSLGYIIKTLNPTRCIIVFDGKGGSQRRRKLYSEYKAHRKSKIVLNRKFDYQTDDEAKESMMHQLKRLIDYLDALPIQVVAMDNIEADDAIAYIVTNFYKTEDSKFTIISTDKDFLQLINDRVLVWNPQTKKMIFNEDIKTQFMTSSKNFILGKIVNGDGSDNIKGIDGISYKKMAKAFPELLNDEELDLDDLYELANNNIKNPTCVKLLQNKDILELNYKLMQLKDVDISGSAKEIIRNIILYSNIPILNKYIFQTLFFRDQMWTGIHNSEQWLSSVFFKLNSFAVNQEKIK